MPTTVINYIVVFSTNFFLQSPSPLVGVLCKTSPLTCKYVGLICHWNKINWYLYETYLTQTAPLTWTILEFALRVPVSRVMLQYAEKTNTRLHVLTYYKQGGGGGGGWYRWREKGDLAKSRREKGDYDWGEGRSYWKGEGKILKKKQKSGIFETEKFQCYIKNPTLITVLQSVLNY